MRNQSMQRSYVISLLTLLILSTFLLPAFSIIEGFPKIHLTDILLPFFGLVVLKHCTFSWINNSKWFLIANGTLLFIAILSLLINHRISSIRDDFEVLKMIKFIVVFLFISIAFELTDSMKILRGIFILVLLFNFMHYTNLFDFNHSIMRFYGSEIQVDTFGLNSLGQPDTKRIIGTLGNPNNNAVLFLFFVVFFFPEEQSKFANKVFFILAIFGTLACQSRTGFIALGLVLVIGFLIKKYSLKSLLVYTTSSISIYVILMISGNIYLNSLAGNIIKQNSVRGRIETWSVMWEMIKLKPLFGYSPNKEHFERTIIYPESEYLLNTWRYGFLGLLAYIMILWSSFFAGFKQRFSKYGFCFTLFSLVIAITAMTNNPLNDAMISMMFAISAGLFYGEQMNSRSLSA
jgi:O-antigen ligase